MKHFLPFFVAIALITATAPRAHAQLFVDTTYTAQQMVTDFFNVMGDCVTTSNITYAGSSQSIGFFESSASNVGLNAGILLSTGMATQAADMPTEFASGVMSGQPTHDSDLDSLLSNGFVTMEKTVIEFDFVSIEPELNFQYVFASEEYPEYVGSTFNDVFGFFVSGPGLNGNQNIALVPNSNIPVAINNVNDTTNSMYYVTNDSSLNSMVYDGFTVPLSASVTVIPGETYHVKLAIADVGDRVLDSGVFIGIESLCGPGFIPPAPEFEADIPAGGMTASFQNFTNYGTYWHWDFGDGTTSELRNPTHTYAQNGTYEVKLESGNFSGNFEHTETITIGTVGVAPIDQMPKPFSLAANPVQNGILQINLAETAMPIHIMLSDLNGRLLQSQYATDKTKIDLTQFGKGMFILQVIANGQTYSEKIVF